MTFKEAMDKYFKVADHIFRLSMPGDSPLWALMANYDPFETHPQQPLFSLELEGTGFEQPGELPIYEEHPDQADMPRAKVYRNDDSWAFSMSPGEGKPYCFLLRTDSNFSNASLTISEDRSLSRFALDNSLMLLFSLCTTPYYTLAMHSSVVLHEGKAYMFLGVSGTGKSTHSRLWLENIPDCELLNDDNPVVRISEDGIARVFGSPWSGKTACYKNLSAPVAAVVQIKQASYNKIRRQQVLEAYTSLLISCSGLRFHEPSEEQMASTQDRFLRSTPFYLMECLPDADAAKVCHGAVSKGYNTNEI